MASKKEKPSVINPNQLYTIKQLTDLLKVSRQYIMKNMVKGERLGKNVPKTGRRYLFSGQTVLNSLITPARMKPNK